MAGIKRFAKNSILPIQIERYDVTDHPAIKSEEKLTHTVQISLNTQEVKYFEGLANIFQGVSRQDAVRVAIHNLAGKDLISARKPGKTDGKRSTVFKLKLSASLHEKLKWDAVAANETVGDYIRRAVWHLSQGIKSGRITRVAGATRKTTKDKLKESAAKSRSNPGSKLTALKQAAELAWDEGIDKKQQEYEELGLFVDVLRGEGLLSTVLDDNGKVCMDTAKMIKDSEANHTENLETEEILKLEKDLAIKQLAKRIARWCDDSETNWKNYIKEATEDWEEANPEPLTDEEEEELYKSLGF